MRSKQGHQALVSLPRVKAEHEKTVRELDREQQLENRMEEKLQRFEDLHPLFYALPTRKGLYGLAERKIRIVEAGTR
jgi:hypothetical protein